MRSTRNQLHINKLDDFKQYLINQHGYADQKTKDYFEAARLKKKGSTIIVHKRLQTHSGNDIVHLTLHGDGQYLFNQYMRVKQEVKDE